MKTGTLIIIEKNGRLYAAVKRKDNQIIELDKTVTPDIQKLNGKTCEYFWKGDKIVKVDGREIYKRLKNTTPQSSEPSKPIQTNWRQKMRGSNFKEPEIIGDMKKPNLSDSFDLSKARVPRDTLNLKINSKDINNLSLKLNQFARFDYKDNKEREKHFKFFNPSLIKKSKKNGGDKVVPTFEIKSNFGFLFNTPNQLINRHAETAKSLFSEKGQLITVRFKPEWRFVIGLGGYSVYETGITLHHIYGIPYIPSSSIKGVLRSWVIFSVFGNKEKEALGNETFCHVFGCPVDSALKKAHQGKVTFFDALPTRSPVIEPDIMNPHYPEWYSGKPNKAPVDTDKPNPVFFLTVKETPFQFLIGSKEFDLTSERFWKGQTLDWWLENALSEHGIGAKTAVGYGYMKKSDE